MAVTGYGAASKAQVQGMVARLLRPRRGPRTAPTSPTRSRWRSRISWWFAPSGKLPAGGRRVIGWLQRLGGAPRITSGAVVLDVSGVGYEVHVASAQQFRSR